MNGYSYNEVDDLQFVFHNIKLTNLIPGYITNEGGYIVTINGEGFVPGLQHQLKLEYNEEIKNYNCEFISKHQLQLCAPKLDINEEEGIREYKASITCNGRDYSNEYPYIVYSGCFTDLTPKYGAKEGGTLLSFISDKPIIKNLLSEQAEYLKVTLKSNTSEQTVPALYINNIIRIDNERLCITCITPKLIEIEPPEPEEPVRKSKTSKKPPVEDPENCTDPVMKISIEVNKYEVLALPEEITFTYLCIKYIYY